MTAKEELLTLLPMKEHTRGEDIFQSFNNFITKTQLPVYKLVSEFDKLFQDFSLLEPVTTILLWYPFREDAEVDSLASKSQHCFTWTLLEWKMRFWHYKQTFSWSLELMECSGTYLQRKSTPTWGNVLPPWLLYSALLIYVSQPFPTWRSLSPSTFPP